MSLLENFKHDEFPFLNGRGILAFLARRIFWQLASLAVYIYQDAIRLTLYACLPSHIAAHPFSHPVFPPTFRNQGPLLLPHPQTPTLQQPTTDVAILQWNSKQTAEDLFLLVLVCHLGSPFGLPLLSGAPICVELPFGYTVIALLWIGRVMDVVHP